MPLIPDPEPTSDKGAPSASTAFRFPDDMLLRHCGWQVYARPKDKPALWRKGELILPIAEALKEAKAGKGKG